MGHVHIFYQFKFTIRDKTDSGQLLTDFLNKGARVKCPAPCHAVNQSKIFPRQGKFSFIAINRRLGYTDEDNHPIPKINTRIGDAWSQSWGNKVLQELVSVITHRGSVHTGHWQTYSKTDDGLWYVNSDAHPPRQTSHPLKSIRKDETAELLVFKNSR